MNVVLLYISNFAYSNECTLYSNNKYCFPASSPVTMWWHWQTLPHSGKAHQTDCWDCQDWHRCTFFQLQLVLMRSVRFQSAISYWYHSVPSWPQEHCACWSFYARKQLCFQHVLAIATLSVRPSVHLSVCPSHGWIRQKRSKLGSPNLHRRLPGRL